jgi:SOS-response transcriptional repressor LexA
MASPSVPEQLCPVCLSAFRTPGFRPKDVRQLITEGRRKLVMNVSAFARAVGVTRAAVQQWERVGGTSPNGTHRPAVARLLGMSVQELLSGGPLPSPGWGRRIVRILSPVEAGGFVSIDNLGPRSQLETVFVTVDVKKHTFALWVHGESMQGSGADSFPPGTIVVVEPDMKARPGDFVIVLNRAKQATFKQLILIDKVSYLKPLNSRFKTRLLGEGVIIGVVREAIWRLR